MIIIKSIRCIFAMLLYLICDTETKARINMDADRNMKWDPNRNKIKKGILRLNYLLLVKREFRNVFYMRTKRHKILCSINNIFLPRVRSIEFGDAQFGGGVLVSHFHSVICPKKTGINFRVGPGAVIGANGEYPTFGDNVYVASNSTVCGNISIGDNVIIGAGSVVSEDLPSNAVYVGNPARFIKHIDDDERLLNEIM